VRTLRGIVVGVGNMGRHHARIISVTPGVQLCGVVDTDLAAARSVASRFGSEAHETVATVSEFDFAVVAVPSTCHLSVGLEVIARGAAVLIEKPLAPTVNDCHRLVLAAEHAGVVLSVGHVERFNQALGILRDRLHNPKLLQFDRLSPPALRTRDSVVMDLMVHDIDLACHLAGEEPTQVQASGGTAYSLTLDYACAQLVFPSGCVASLVASRVTHDKIRRIAASTPSEFLMADSLRQEVIVKRETTVEFPDDAQAWYRQASIIEIPRLGAGVEPLKAQMSAFLRALRGEAPPVVTGAEAMLAVRLALDIERSALRVSD
jgi:predicted dehydrogenase